MKTRTEIISDRIKPLTHEGKLLHDLTKGAKEQIYDFAKKTTEEKFTSKIRWNAYGRDLNNRANEFFYEQALTYDEAKVDQVCNGKSHWYTKVEINNLILTISQVESKRQLVRGSNFRNDLSEYNPTLFNPDPKPISGINTIYAVITHGPVNSSMNPKLSNRNIGFLNIGVIDETYTDYVYFRDLFKLCSIERNYKEATVKVNKEQATEEAEVKIKKTAN